MFHQHCSYYKIFQLHVITQHDAYRHRAHELQLYYSILTVDSSYSNTTTCYLARQKLGQNIIFCEIQIIKSSESIFVIHDCFCLLVA